MKTIRLIVKTGPQKYPILIGSNLISKISKILKANSLEFNKYLLVIDKNVPNPTAIAIMTDTDDSNQSAPTYYGPIHFSAKC